MNPTQKRARKKYCEMSVGHENDTDFHLQNFWEFSGLSAEAHRISQERDQSVRALMNCGVFHLTMISAQASLQALSNSEEQWKRELVKASCDLMVAITTWRPEFKVAVKILDLVHLAATSLIQRESIVISNLPHPLREIVSSFGFPTSILERQEIAQRTIGELKANLKRENCCEE